jgi:hypothetical protein
MNVNSTGDPSAAKFAGNESVKVAFCDGGTENANEVSLINVIP